MRSKENRGESKRTETEERSAGGLVVAGKSASQNEAGGGKADGGGLKQIGRPH